MYLIVGCGLSGATIAERISNVLNKKVFGNSFYRFNKKLDSKSDLK